MICKPLGARKGWEIIYQRNHALLAAEMLAPWPAERRPQPWFELLNACSQHDHGWLESRLDSLVDEEGQPIDFLHMTTEATLAMSRRNLRNAEAQSRWCAILVARHLEYLFSAKDDTATADLARQTRSARLDWMKEVSASEAQVEELYELLSWADSLSLLVCCQPSEFTESLALKAQGQNFQARQVQEDVWSLSPWPYLLDSLCLTYEVRVLEQQRFDDAQALRDALARASVSLRRLELRP